MKNKKAIELSINFLVVVILSIAMLSLGLYLVRNFFVKTQEIKADLDTQTQSKITELLAFGEMTALPFNKKTIPVGEHKIFGIGILNVEREARTFRVEIEANKAFDRTNNPIPGFEQGVEQEWLLYDQEEFVLEPQEQKSVPILVKTPKTPRGTYIFDVEVINVATEERYGNINKIYVQVP